MRCPFCDYSDTNVIDSRLTSEWNGVRRRRKCGKCEKKFTTYERVEPKNTLIIKKDGRRQKFDRNKIISGMIKACEKRPVPYSTIENAVDRIEDNVENYPYKEIKASAIGEMVMEELKQIDDVAYVRFSSVYRQFTDTETFIKEINELKKSKE